MTPDERAAIAHLINGLAADAAACPELNCGDHDVPISIAVALLNEPLDIDRLARALARRADRTDAWVLLPKEMQDLWRKDAAAIAKAYEEEK